MAQSMVADNRSYKAVHEQSRPKAGVVFYCGEVVALFFWSTLAHLAYRENVAKDGEPGVEAVTFFFHHQMIVTVKGHLLARLVTDCQQCLTDYVRVSPGEPAGTNEPFILSIEIQPMGKA